MKLKYFFPFFQPFQTPPQFSNSGQPRRPNVMQQQQQQLYQPPQAASMASNYPCGVMGNGLQGPSTMYNPFQHPPHVQNLMMAGGGTPSRQTQPYVPTSMGHGRGNPAAHSGGQIAAAAAAAAAIQEQQVGVCFLYYNLILVNTIICLEMEFQFHEIKNLFFFFMKLWNFNFTPLFAVGMVQTNFFQLSLTIQFHKGFSPIESHWLSKKSAHLVLI